MNAASKVEKPAAVALPKEAKITILSLLKNFYDEQIFAILVKDFYNSDLEVSLAAINASASLGNEMAVPRLYEIIEKGKPQQKVAAIQTLASINAPSAIEQLAKYFTILQTVDIRKEILKAINRISPMHPKAHELNRAVLVDPAMAREFYEIILGGLLESGDLEAVKSHLLRAPPDVQRVLFYKILAAGSEEASDFLKSFQDKTAQFDPNTLGCYLCAYELKVSNPQASFVFDLLAGADPRTITSFIISLTNYNGRIPNPNHIFRLLLRIPYVDQDTEGLTGGFIAKIVAEIRSYSPLLLNEFIFTTATSLETVLAKIKKQHISLKGIKEREALLVVVLAKILEQYATAELLAEAQSFFKSEGPDNPASLIARIKEHMISAPEDEQNRFEACLPLFSDTDRLVRLNISHTLARINLASPALLRRLNRLIRVVGILEIRSSAKKIGEVLAFAREERIPFLEESSVVTLCQLMNRTAIEQAKVVFAEPAKFPHALHGFIRGARYVPVQIFISSLLKLLLVPTLPPKTRALIVDSLKNMNLDGIKAIMAPLIRAMRLTGLERNLLLDLSAVVSRYGDSAIFQPLLDLAGSADVVVSQVGIRTLRNLTKREKNLPLDVLTNRLYRLLEHKLKSIQIEALLTLIALQDDYALQILDDQVQSKDEAAIVEILANLEKPLSHDMIGFLLKLLVLDSAPVHRELRRVLPEFCQGGEAEEIRRTLLNALKGAITVSAPTPPPVEVEGGLIAHAKLEFKFRRENEQELTVLFTDVVGYTEKTSSSGAVNLMKLIQDFEGITLPTIAAFKGTLIKKMGDGLLAVFKHPLNAAIASLQIQKKIREYNQYRTDTEKFYVRIGLNTGTVIRKDSDIFGDTVNVASRMQTLANPGSILLPHSTYDRIKDSIRCTRLGDLQVKGKAEAITTYTAEELLIDEKQFLGEAKQGDAKQAVAAEARTPADLKESMFEPDFRPPAGVQIEERLLRSLQALFKDFTKVVEDIAKDYHEEYLLKRYLQDKWNELFPV